MQRVTGELGELAATATEEAQRLLVNAKRALRRARAEAERLRKRGVQTRRRGGGAHGWPRGRATKIHVIEWPTGKLTTGTCAAREKQASLATTTLPRRIPVPPVGLEPTLGGF